MLFRSDQHCQGEIVLMTFPCYVAADVTRPGALAAAAWDTVPAAQRRWLAIPHARAESANGIEAITKAQKRRSFPSFLR